MNRRALAKIFVVAACAFHLNPGRSLVSAQDADTRTQSFLDTHKEADPINTERALTDTVKKPKEHYVRSSLPPLSVPSARQKKLRKQIAALQQESKKRKNQLAKERRAALGFDAAPVSRAEVERAWNESAEGKQINADLKRLEKEAKQPGTKSTLPPLGY